MKLSRMAFAQQQWRAKQRAGRNAFEVQERFEIDTWYPFASDLILLSVPEKKRSYIRRRIQPWLANLWHPYDGRQIGVEAGFCWRTAQALVMTAGVEDVKYIEGVWNRRSDFQGPGDKSNQSEPHAWVTIEGYLVDLTGEFYAWRTPAKNNEWVYEPFREFSWSELSKFLHDTPSAYDESVCVTQFLLGGYKLPRRLKRLQDHLSFHQLFDEWSQKLVFRPAIERMWRRHVSRGSPKLPIRRASKNPTRVFFRE